MKKVSGPNSTLVLRRRTLGNVQRTYAHSGLEKNPTAHVGLIGAGKPPIVVSEIHTKAHKLSVITTMKKIGDAIRAGKGSKELFNIIKKK